MTRVELEQMAASYGWEFLTWQKDISMLSFSKPNSKGTVMRINIYVTKMTVATCLDHPKHGKTQLFRRAVTQALMGKIFKNPRLHTDSGYRKK